MQQYYLNVFGYSDGKQRLGETEHPTRTRAEVSATFIAKLTYGKTQAIGRWRVIPKQKGK